MIMNLLSLNRWLVLLKVRRIIQLYFLLFYAVAGYLFYTLVEAALSGSIADFSLRFPAIEAFLPLSALVGLTQLLKTGVFDQIHPAGLSILLIALGSALIFRRGICSHICPIGTLSELLTTVRNRIVRSHISLPRTIHYVLMLPKYILLLFFLSVIVVGMSGSEASAFIISPYNIVTDAKMLRFFLFPSQVTVEVITLLVTLTLLIPFFWCRYLCPYGALLTAAAIFAPVHIRRKHKLCDSCGICDRQCPSGIRISTVSCVNSPDCSCCHRCTDACPANALSLYNRLTAKPLKAAHYSWALITLFSIGLLIAKASGHWDSPLLPAVWPVYLPQIDAILHP